VNQLKTLFHKSKDGKLDSWEVKVEGATIISTYGEVGGKMQVARKECLGKNVGRSNETTPPEQAQLEAAAMHKKRLKLKYSLTPQTAEATVFLPMLAHKFLEAKKVVYPVHEQPKLNGVRCLAYWKDGSVRLMSRGGETYDIEHIRKDVASFLPKNLVLDGEIYLHGVTLQAVSRLVKKYRPGETEKLQLWVYDLFEEDKTDTPWSERVEQLEGLLDKYDLFASSTMPHTRKDGDSSVVVVGYMPAANEEEVLAIQKGFVKEGFEGGIVRLLDGEYELGYRSHSLLKIKTYKDAEFEIIGYGSGAGKFVDCVIWTCKTKEGKQFNVVPKGTLEKKRRLLKEAKQHIGEQLTVRYFDFSEDGIPEQPVGLDIRDEADKS